MGDFELHNRKYSAYIPRNELNLSNNRKISAYSTFANYLSRNQQTGLTRTIKQAIKDKLQQNFTKFFVKSMESLMNMIQLTIS
jgi:hypothetical protein